MSKLLPVLAILMPLAATAATPRSEAFDPRLEPCMNAEVSADGTLPSAELAQLRQQFHALARPSDNPYYVFMRDGRIIVQP